ncbi:MAG: tetratricopeptide repeat protein, partial [Nannocystaceae bacterium]
RLGDNATAIDHYNRARRIFEATFGADTPPLAYPLTGLGEAELNTGNHAGARELLEQALPLRDSGDKPELAHTRFVLARAVVDDQHDRALELAEKARQGYTESGPAYVPELKEVIAWQALHPRPNPD